MTILINLADILNHNVLTCAKHEIGLDSCIVVNGEKSESHVVTLNLIGQFPLSNSSELHILQLCLSFQWIEQLFFELSCTRKHRQTDTQTDTHTGRHKYSVVVVDKPQL